MKNILKSIGLGVTFLIMSYMATLFGYITWAGFSVVNTATGFEAAWLVAASLVTGFLSLFILFCMGGLPLVIIDDLKQKLR